MLEGTDAETLNEINGDGSNDGEKRSAFDRSGCRSWWRAAGPASIHVQRRRRIGYNGAARLIEAMEQAGIVSRPNAMGKREVLAPKRKNETDEIYRHCCCRTVTRRRCSRKRRPVLTDFWFVHARSAVACGHLPQEVRDKDGRVSRQSSGSSSGGRANSDLLKALLADHRQRHHGPKTPIRSPSEPASWDTVSEQPLALLLDRPLPINFRAESAGPGGSIGYV